MQYIRIYYRNPDITSIKKLFEEEKIVNISISDFLEMEDPYKKKKNKDSLFEAYTEQQKSDLGLNSSDDIKETTPIYPPAVLYVNVENATIDILKNDSKFIKREDYRAFLDKEIEKIVNNEGYTKFDVIKTYPQANFWVWCKAIEYFEHRKLEIGGTILNFSDFIQNMKISLTETGGNFTITIPSIPAGKRLFSNPNDPNDIADFESWDFTDSQTQKYETENGTERVIRTTLDLDESEAGVIIQGRSKNSNIKRKYRYIPETRSSNFPLLSLNTNDIVFLKFERLNLEENSPENGLLINNDKLPNEVFDLIGLIDNVTVEANNSEVNVTITGRDLTKLILDDGSFFFFNSYSAPQSQSGVFTNANENQGDGTSTLNKLLAGNVDSAGRFFGNGSGHGSGIIMPWFNPSARTIGSVLDVLIKQLANIQICPDSLFEYYGDRRTRFTKETITKKE